MGGAGSANCINIGVKDKNHRTAYGTIIRDPQSNGAYDRIALTLPNQQIKAKVSVKEDGGGTTLSGLSV